jgi:hypothetical protein
MALADVPLPFGLRDVKLQRLSDDGTSLVGGLVDLPYARTFSFTESEEFEELRGDDSQVASHGAGPIVEWEMESGGLKFEAVSVMYGGTVSTTGVSPNLVKRWRKLSTDARPYFRATGQSISDSGGDVHGVVYRCKATDNMEGEMSDGSFFLTSGSGQGMPNLIPGDDINALYDWLQHETTTGIS